MEIKIDNFDFYNMKPQRYYSFSKAFKGDKKDKAKELVYSNAYLGSRKMDGFWSMIIKDLNGQYCLRSRTESVNGGYVNKAEWIPHICEALEKVPNGTVLIGEIYLPNNEGSRKVTSVLNCLKDKCLEKQKSDGWLHFYVFDIVAWNEKSLIDTAFEKRVDYIENKLGYLIKTSDPIELAEYVRGEDLWKLYEDVIISGGEGIVITRQDCHYLCDKRTAWMTLKLKKELEDTIDAFLDGDFKMATRLYNGMELETWSYWENTKTGEKFNTCKILDYMKGETLDPITKAYYYGWASSVSFSVMDGDSIKQVGWISGITDELKKEIVSNTDKWKYKVAELTAMEIEQIDGTYSLRHGKIERWRGDKNYKDCLLSQIVN